MAQRKRGKKPTAGKTEPKPKAPTRITIRLPEAMIQRMGDVAKRLGPGFSATTIARLAIVEGLPGIERRYLAPQPAQDAPQAPKSGLVVRYDGEDEDAAAAALGVKTAPAVMVGGGDLGAPGAPGPFVAPRLIAPTIRRAKAAAAKAETSDPDECQHGVRWDAFIPCPDCALLPPKADVPEDGAPLVSDVDLEGGA